MNRVAHYELLARKYEMDRQEIADKLLYRSFDHAVDGAIYPILESILRLARSHGETKDDTATLAINVCMIAFNDICDRFGIVADEEFQLRTEYLAIQTLALEKNQMNRERFLDAPDVLPSCDEFDALTRDAFSWVSPQSKG